MRTVTNNNIFSMFLLRTWTKSIKRFEPCENSDQSLAPYLMKSEKGIITRGPIPYDGREGMFLRWSKRIKSLANSEDESEDDLKSLGISHLKGIPSSLKIHRSEPHPKEGEFRTPV